MRKSNYYITFLLSLFLIFSLFACSKTSDSPNLEQNNPDTQNIDETSGLHLALPNSTCTTICSKIPSEELEISLTAPIANEEAADALLEGTVDVVLLSPQKAADLYRNGKKVQVIAVVSPGDPDTLDSMQCLVVRTEYLEKHSELVEHFFTLYQKTAQQKSIDDAFLATGWDMLDLVQESLEAQFEKQPDPNHSIPDGNFYYILS